MKLTMKKLEGLLKQAEKAHAAYQKKIGRTHLMDALPVTIGSEFAAYATSITKAREAIVASQKELQNIALG